MNEAVSINAEVLELDSGTPRLKGGRCADCGTYVFPRVSGCPNCAGSRIDATYLETEGTLWAWTVQGFPPKAPPYLGETDPDRFVAYGVGYVELPGQLKVEGRLTENDPKRLKEGMRMRLTTVPLTEEDGKSLVTFAFEPVE